MYLATNEQLDQIKKLFCDEESKILKAYLQGHMGDAWVNDLENPTAAQVKVDFFSFFAGDVNADNAKSLLTNLEEHNLIIVKDNKWKRAIEEFYKNNQKMTRYSFHDTNNAFDTKALEGYINDLSDDYQIKAIDLESTQNPGLGEVLDEYGASFESKEDYLNRGFGYYITKGDDIACVVSTYSVYDDGIEIDIATKKSHQGKGLATVAAAKMMLECLKKNLHPNWDAANKTSYHMALKLGYKFNEAYDTYYVHVEQSNK